MAEGAGRRDATTGATERSGFLSTLPAPAAQRLLEDALILDVPAGGTVYRDEDEPRTIVVRDGLVRTYRSSPDGRQVTIRYARRGDIVGLALAIGGPAPLSIQALTDASVAALRVSVLRELLESDAAVAQACARELARQLYHAFDEIADNAFLAVRQRVARQLLDMAVHEADGGLVVHITQQGLADAIASAREVVSRAVHELKAAGLIAPARDRIVILDPLGLAGEIA